MKMIFSHIHLISLLVACFLCAHIPVEAQQKEDNKPRLSIRIECEQASDLWGAEEIFGEIYIAINNMPHSLWVKKQGEAVSLEEGAHYDAGTFELEKSWFSVGINFNKSEPILMLSSFQIGAKLMESDPWFDKNDELGEQTQEMVQEGVFAFPIDGEILRFVHEGTIINVFFTITGSLAF